MDKASLKKRVKRDSSGLVKKHLIKKFEEVSKQIQEMILYTFDNELSAIADRKSKVNPSFYREDFEERLENFSYIEEQEGTVSLIVPDIENFDFSGKLHVIKTVMEGVVGTYVELDKEQYKQIFNHRSRQEEPIIVRYSSKIRQTERNLNIEFPRYPLSNKPPIDLMEPAENFVNSNIERWIDEAIEDANKELVNVYKGVK